MRLRWSLRPLAVVLAALAGLSTAFAAGLVVAQHHEPSSVLDQALAQIMAKSAMPQSVAALDAGAIRGMLTSIDDRWAAYYGAGTGTAGNNELRALLAGRYDGLGVWLRRNGATHQVAVASVSVASPAALAGVSVGDLIEAVDGQPVAFADVDTVSALLRGPAGSTVRLLVRDSGGVLRTLSMRRADLPVADVSSEWAAPGVMRIRIATFSAGVAAQLAAAVRAARAAHMQAILLDLRGNPGGLLSEALACASLFLDGGPVVSLEGRSVPQETLLATGHGDITTPMAVLVDGGTASAAEILAGALQDRGRAVLVGSRTFGKGSVQQVVRLSDGAAFELTVARYFTPSGRSVDGVGLTPDVWVSPTAAPSVATDRAIALVEALTSAALPQR